MASKGQFYWILEILGYPLYDQWYFLQSKLLNNNKTDLTLLLKVGSGSPLTTLKLILERYGWWKTVRDFIFGGSKITADGDCSHEIKRHLLPGRKALTNIDSILKSRDITLPTKVRLVKAMVFPGVKYGCESWTIKRKLSTKELMLLNCGVGEDSWESLGQQGDQTSQS